MLTPTKIIIVPLYVLSIAALLIGASLDFPNLAIVGSYGMWILGLCYFFGLFLLRNDRHMPSLGVTAGAVVYGAVGIIISFYIVGDFIGELIIKLRTTK